jgi:hypothetical protein
MPWNEPSLPMIAGWQGQPTYSAQPISGLVGDILKNRQFEQVNVQNQIANLAKTIREQRENAAFGEQVSNAGLLPGVDTSNLSAAQTAALAKLVQEQHQTSQEKYYDALTNILNKTGQLPSRQRAGTGGKVWMPELNNGQGGWVTSGQAFNIRKSQADVLGKQATEIEQQQETYGLPSGPLPALGTPESGKMHGYVMRDGKLVYAQTPEEQAHPQFVSPGDVLAEELKKPIDPNAATLKYPAVPPIFTPEVYTERQKQSAKAQELLKRQQDVQSQITKLPSTEDTGDTGGGGGGPHDQAISQANQIKADFKAGKITAEQARTQIQALNIPNLQ